MDCLYGWALRLRATHLFTYKATGNRYPASHCIHLTRCRPPVQQRLDGPILMQKVVG